MATAQPEIVAERAALRSLLPGTVVRDDAAGTDRALGQLRVFDAVLSALDALSAVSPTLLVVEDLHWADRSSRDLLVFLLSRLTAQRLVVLATYRRDDLHRRHPLRPMLSEVVRLPAVERLELEPLGGDESLELVRRLADGSVDEASLRRIARRSEGNAFFAEELVTAAPSGVPEGLAEVLMARIEALPAMAQRVLRIAAVSGRKVRHEVLAAVSDLGDDELEQALRDAVAHHVLVPDRERAPPRARAPTATSSATRCCARRCTRSCCPASAPAARPVRATARRAGRGVGDRRRARPPRLCGPRPAAGPVRVHRRRGGGRLARRARRGAVPARTGARAVARRARRRGRRRPSRVEGHAVGRQVRGLHRGPGTRLAQLGRRSVEVAEDRHDAAEFARNARTYAMLLLDLPGREQEALVMAHKALAIVEDGPPSANLAWAHATLARTLWRADRATEARSAGARSRRRRRRHRRAGRDGPRRKADGLVTSGRPAVEEEERARQLIGEASSSRAGPTTSPWSCARTSTSACPCSTPAGSGRVAAFAEGEARAESVGLSWSGYGIDLRVVHVIAMFMLGGWDRAEAAASSPGAWCRPPSRAG